MVFFADLGFRREAWEVLTTALRRLAQPAEVSSHAESPHSWKYVVVGRLESPEGRTAMVQTVWIVDKGLEAARLLTAYPHREGGA